MAARLHHKIDPVENADPLLLDQRSAELHHRVELAIKHPSETRLEDIATTATSGALWQLAQELLLKTGPSPSETPSTSSKTRLPSDELGLLSSGKPRKRIAEVWALVPPKRKHGEDEEGRAHEGGR